MESWIDRKLLEVKVKLKKLKKKDGNSRPP